MSSSDDLISYQDGFEFDPSSDTSHLDISPHNTEQTTFSGIHSTGFRDFILTPELLRAASESLIEEDTTPLPSSEFIPAREGPRAQGISHKVFDDLVFYFKYASTAYGVPCRRPNGKVLVEQLVCESTAIKGFIARDDDRKEIVLALRGSADMNDVLTDSRIKLVPFESPGVCVPEGALVHSGFLTAWNLIASSVISNIGAQLQTHCQHSIVTTGHSLGGALASLAAISLKSHFPTSKTRMYTYGQPRTGNLVYAQFVNSEFGYDAYRAVHMNDGVPTMIPRAFGYHHHGIEYWQFIEPPLPLTTTQCDPEGEDLLCSGCIMPSGGINAAHLTYFGIPAGTPFCS